VSIRNHLAIVRNEILSMKIVFIGGRDIHMLGGIENYMYNLATELVKMGHTPIVYCESDHDAIESVNGFEVRYIKGPKSNLLCKPYVGLKATLKTVLKEKDVNLIHYNAWPPSLWSWIPSIFGIPSLMEGHGLEWKRSKYGNHTQRILKYMEGYSARHNKNLLMCSEDQVRYFLENYGKKAECMPGAIHLPSPSEGTSSDILERFALMQGKYFLFMGRLVQDKNPDYLIKAFLKAGIKGYKLVIAGDNAAMPDYVKSLHDMSRGSDIVFTGAVYGEDKAALLRNAFAFCLPSTIEGLSIVLMEAMSYKLPVIASNIEANKELLANNAIYVTPENEQELVNALTESVRNPIPSDKIESNYQFLIKNYTWEKIAVKYIDYIGKIIQ